jgi:hypothetical protein
MNTFISTYTIMLNFYFLYSTGMEDVDRAPSPSSIRQQKLERQVIKSSISEALSSSSSFYSVS